MADLIEQHAAREHLARLLPMTRTLGLRKAWAATIDYTPDHLPILGPALDAGGESVRAGDGRVIAEFTGYSRTLGGAVVEI